MASGKKGDHSVCDIMDWAADPQGSDRLSDSKTARAFQSPRELAQDHRDAQVVNVAEHLRSQMWT